MTPGTSPAYTERPPTSTGRLLRQVMLFDAVGWCVVLLLPGDTFGLNKSYAWMARQFPEEWWAVLFGLGALIMGVGMAIGPGRVRSAAAVMAAVMHGLLAFNFVQTWPLSTGTVTHLCMMRLAYALIAIEARR